MSSVRRVLLALCLVILLSLVSPLAFADEPVPPSVADLKEELLSSRALRISDSVVVAPPETPASASAAA